MPSKYRIVRDSPNNYIIQKKVFWFYWKKCARAFSDYNYAHERLIDVMEHDKKREEERKFKKVVVFGTE